MNEKVAMSVLRAARSVRSCMHPARHVRSFSVQHAVLGATTLDRCQLCGAIRLGVGVWVLPHGVMVLSAVLGGDTPRADAPAPADVAELLLLYECELADSTGADVLMPREHLRTLLSACEDVRYGADGDRMPRHNA